MSWDTEALQEYEIFKGIMGNNLSTLLDCISAKIVDREAGEEILPRELHEKMVALILEGEVLAEDVNGKEVMLKKGELLGKGFAREIHTSTPSKALVFNHREVYTPCWFSCFFHAGFMDNIDKASANVK